MMLKLYDVWQNRGLKFVLEFGYSFENVIKYDVHEYE